MFSRIFVLSVVFGVFVSFNSLADSTASPWDCMLQTTTLSGFSYFTGSSTSLARGTGVVQCTTNMTDSNNKSERSALVEVPVRVQLLGDKQGLGYTRIRHMKVRVIAHGLAGPSDLFGAIKPDREIPVSSLAHGDGLGIYSSTSSFDNLAEIEFSEFNGYGFETNVTVKALSILPVENPMTNIREFLKQRTEFITK